MRNIDMKSFYQITSKSLSEIGVANYKELWDKVGDNHRGLSIGADTEFVQVKENENRFSVTMSTENKDRHGDIVMQNWDLKPFKANPVFLDSHNYGSIEHIIGRVNNPKVRDNKLLGEVEFNLDNPKGLLAYNMAQKGFLNATSVGFMPLSFTDKGDIEKSELLELSAVSVPANAEALFERAIKGIEENNDDEEVEENGDETQEQEVDETVDETADEVEVEETETATENDEAEEKKEVKNLIKHFLVLMKDDISEKEARKKKLIKQVTILMGDIASGRSSKKSVNKAVKKLLEIKKID